MKLRWLLGLSAIAFGEVSFSFSPELYTDIGRSTKASHRLKRLVYHG